MIEATTEALLEGETFSPANFSAAEADKLVGTVVEIAPVFDWQRTTFVYINTYVTDTNVFAGSNDDPEARVRMFLGTKARLRRSDSAAIGYDFTVGTTPTTLSRTDRIGFTSRTIVYAEDAATEAMEQAGYSESRIDEAKNAGLVEAEITPDEIDFAETKTETVTEAIVRTVGRLVDGSDESGLPISDDQMLGLRILASNGYEPSTIFVDDHGRVEIDNVDEDGDIRSRARFERDGSVSVTKYAHGVWRVSTQSMPISTLESVLSIFE